MSTFPFALSHGRAWLTLLHVDMCVLQRETMEKVKEMSKKINSANQGRLAKAIPAPPKPQEPSVRRKAVEYAKTMVPVPKQEPAIAAIREKVWREGQAAGGA